MTFRAAALLCAIACSYSAHTAYAHSNGTVFSGPTDSDGAAVYWNPAAMAGANTSRLDIIANFYVLQATYARAGTDPQQGGAAFPKVSLVTARPEPTLGLIIDKVWHQRLRLGFSVSAPNVAGAAWPETVNVRGQTVLGPTRYYATSAEIFHAFTQFAASFALHRTFAIGVSANLVFSYLNFSKDIDLANQEPIRTTISCGHNPLGCENPSLSAPVNLRGSGVSGGASVGVFWQPILRLRIGVAYISPVKVDVGASLAIDSKKLNDFARQFLPTYGTLLYGSGSVQLTVPQRVNAGIAFDITPRIELSAIMTWINFSAADVISVIVSSRSSTLVPAAQRLPGVQNDQWSAILRVVGRIRERWKLALSLEYIGKTTPDVYATPSSIDFDSFSVNLGANVRLRRWLALGASFSQTFVIPRTITTSAFGNDAPVPYNLPDPSGSYSGNAERAGLDLTAFF